MEDQFDIKGFKKHIRNKLKESKGKLSEDPHDQWEKGNFYALEQVITIIDQFYLKEDEKQDDAITSI